MVKRRSGVGVALLAAALVVAGVVVVSRSGRATEPAEVLAAVDEVRVFVERERDLPFPRPLPVRVLSDEDFDRFAAGVAQTKVERGRANAGKTAGLLVALGLLPRGTDLLGELSALSGSKVVLYDGDELVVRAVQPTARVRVQYARELAHALLDQRFGLDRPAVAAARDGSGFALTALVAADVLRVAAAYQSSLPDQVATDDSRPADRRIPPAVARFAALPNEKGPALVDAIIARGGLRALDEAFADPPESAGQVLFPERYFDRRGPVEVPAPDADGPVFDEGLFGLDHLVYLLGDSPTSDAAVRAWSGDRYVAWRAGDRACVRIAFAGSTPRGADDLGDALSLWAASRRGAASVTRSGDQVVVSSCEAVS